MTAAAILTRLRDLGVTVRPDGNVLRLRPAAAVPPDLLVEVKAQKADLLALLAANDANPLAAVLEAGDDPEPGCEAECLAWARRQARAGWPSFVTAPAALPPASPEQAEAERQDRAAIAAEGEPSPAEPVDAGTLGMWHAELAELLAAAPAQRITDPEKAAAYFAAEARRRLGAVRHDRQAAGLLMGVWRHAREART